MNSQSFSPYRNFPWYFQRCSPLYKTTLHFTALSLILKQPCFTRSVIFMLPHFPDFFSLSHRAITKVNRLSFHRGFDDSRKPETTSNPKHIAKINCHLLTIKVAFSSRRPGLSSYRTKGNTEVTRAITRVRVALTFFATKGTSTEGSQMNPQPHDTLRRKLRQNRVKTEASLTGRSTRHKNGPQESHTTPDNGCGIDTALLRALTRGPIGGDKRSHARSEYPSRRRRRDVAATSSWPYACRIIDYAKRVPKSLCFFSPRRFASQAYPQSTWPHFQPNN